MIFLTTGPAALATREQWLPVLQRAIDDADGRWTAEQVLSDVADGRLIVWIVSRETKVVGVFTTRIVESAIRYVAVEDLAGEDMESWLWEAHRALETWARELGAQQITFDGRRGWQRVLQSLGYETKRIQGVKRLENLQ
jgi:hypothetical protein